ncbi:hypothetical protein GJ496_004043 [Pomphorhynchus laevis]|nr:hypothetical protein GJ496_004043 [Pomphorhynchus laevis]
MNAIQTELFNSKEEIENREDFSINLEPNNLSFHTGYESLVTCREHDNIVNISVLNPETTLSERRTSQPTKYLHDYQWGDTVVYFIMIEHF